MTKIKTLLLALTLAVTPALAQDKSETYTRAEFQQACMAQAPDNVDPRVVKNICECATQYASAMLNGKDRFADFAITQDNPLVSEAVPVCLSIAGDMGLDKFFEVFEQTKVGARGR